MGNYVKSSTSSFTARGNYYGEVMSGATSIDLDSKRKLLNVKSLDGWTNPHWRQSVKQHVQAGTIMSASDIRYSAGDHSILERYNWVQAYKPSHPKLYHSSGNFYTSIPYYNYSGTSLVTKADNEAKTKYISAANDAIQVLQSGELIGEFAELTRQVSSPGKALRSGLGDYIRAIRNRTASFRNRRGSSYFYSRQQAQVIRDTWLEYSFGWRPLINEIDQVIDYVNEKDPTSRLDIRNIQGVGRAKESVWLETTKTQRTIGIPGIKARQRGFAEVIVIYRGQAGMANNAAGYVAEKVGFAPTQWLPTAWELLPYSFLLDYFANIGDMIYAFSFPTSSLRWTMKTVVKTSEGRFVDIEPLYKYNDNIQGQAPYKFYTTKEAYGVRGASTRLKTVERGPYSGSFIPTLEFSIPGSGTKWLNMGALFLGSRLVQKLLS